MSEEFNRARVGDLDSPSDFDKWVRHCLSHVDNDGRARPEDEVFGFGLVPCGWVDVSRIYQDSELEKIARVEGEAWTCPRCGGSAHDYSRLGDTRRALGG